MTDPVDIDRLLDVVSQRLAAPETLDEKLLEVTHAACDNLPGVDYASITILATDGGLSTSAATDAVINEADRWQYELQEGPCYDAVMDEDIFTTHDVGTDERWPEFGPLAHRLGLKAQAAVPLYRHAGSRVALNLYARSAEAFTDPEHLIAIFARQAALMLGHANEVHNLRAASFIRKAIGQAIGIVMERYRINDDKAFEYLIRASQAGNITLRTVAEELVGHANRAPQQAGAAEA